MGDLKATAIWLLGALFVGVMQGSMGFITVVLAELFPLKFRGLSMGSRYFHVDHERGGQLSVPLLQAKLGLGPVFLSSPPLTI